MKEPKIKQFKLTNNDEIICEVIEYDTPDNSAILMRGALKVMESFDFERGIRFFGFKPWMCFNDNPSVLLTLNSSHIIGEVIPGKRLSTFYFKTIVDLKQALKERKVKDISTEQLEDAMNNLNDEDWNDYVNEHLVNKTFDPDIFTEDSADPKIIHFDPSKKTMH